MGEISKLGAVSLNCPDPHELAVFYSALLEKEIAFESDDFSAIQLDNLWLSFQRVADFKPSTWPTNETPSLAHLDFSVSNLDAGEAAALAAGARLAPATTRARPMARAARPGGQSLLRHDAHSGLTTRPT